MAEFDTTNRGALFFNVEKKNEKAPDYDLSFNFGGKDYRIAAWKKTTSQGKKMITFRIEDGAPGEGSKGGKGSGNDGW